MDYIKQLREKARRDAEIRRKARGGMSLKELAALYALTRQRIHQIVGARNGK